MNKLNEANPQTVSTGQPSDLGKQLRRAREANGLTVQSVSVSLRLTPRIVIALEEGDFAQLQPVYVKGYLRNYGRLLNLSVEPLIKSYDRILQQAQIPLKMPKQSPKKSKSSLVLVLPLAVIVLATLGWIARTVIFPIADIPAPTGVDASHLSMQSGDANTIENSPKSLEKLSDTDGTTEQIGGAGEQPGADILADKPIPSVTTLTYQFVGPPKPGSGDTLDGKPASASQPAVLANPAEASQPGDQGVDTIAVHLSAKAWVGIRDHTGRRLVYKRLPAGTDIGFSGQAPFLVVLGNSSATKIQFNGKPYQLPKSEAGGITRLTIGQNEAPGE